MPGRARADSNSGNSAQAWYRGESEEEQLTCPTPYLHGAKSHLIGSPARRCPLTPPPTRRPFPLGSSGAVSSLETQPSPRPALGLMFGVLWAERCPANQASLVQLGLLA